MVLLFYCLHFHDFSNLILRVTLCFSLATCYIIIYTWMLFKTFEKYSAISNISDLALIITFDINQARVFSWGVVRRTNWFCENTVRKLNDFVIVVRKIKGELYLNGGVFFVLKVDWTFQNFCCGIPGLHEVDSVSSSGFVICLVYTTFYTRFL